MKRLKLSQPYASMVVAGILQTVPNLWLDLKYGEKIFIYADGVDKEFENGPDYNKTFHRRVYNEMFLGNIPDGDFPTHQYIGYVRAYYTGIIDKDWLSDRQKSVFVTLPYKLTTAIDKFDCDEKLLEEANARKVCTKAIQKKGADLYVPVCKNVWKRLNNLDECRGVCMFWEDYMSEFAPICFSLEDNGLDEIDEVRFQYNGRTIRFATYGGIGEDYVHLDNINGVINLLRFNLDYKIDGPTIIKIETSKKTKEDKLSDDAFEDEIEGNPKEYHPPYAHIIFTPMGGMTRWKRR